MRPTGAYGLWRSYTKQPFALRDTLRTGAGLAEKDDYFRGCAEPAMEPQQRSHRSASRSIEANHLAECLVRSLRVIARSFVAHEGMLGAIQLLRERDTSVPQSLRDLPPRIFWYMRVQRSPHEQQLTPNLARSLQRTRIGIAPQFSTVNAGPIKAHRRLHLRLQRGAKCQVTAD